jgi:hypothetical protein
MTGETSSPKPKAKKSPGPIGPRVRGGGQEARRLSVVILEVLAGMRTPADAAQALGRSVPRYYQLEARALEGLVAGCEPRSVGRAKTPEREIEKLKQEVARLNRECARSQALQRMAQRTVGVSAVKPRPAPKPGEKRKRRPTARALKAAAGLKRDVSTSVVPDGSAEERQASAGEAP